MSWLGNLFGAGTAIVHGDAAAQSAQLAREQLAWIRQVHEKTARFDPIDHYSIDRAMKSTALVMAPIWRDMPTQPPKRQRLTHCCGCGAALAWAGALHTTCSYCKTEHHA